MGAYKSKDPRFRSSIERGSKVFRRAILDSDLHPRARRSRNDGETPSVQANGMRKYSSLDNLHRRGLTDSRTSEERSEGSIKASLWDGDIGILEEEDPGFRPRSSTYSGPHERHKHLSVHFATNLVSTRPSSHRSTGDIHLKGILRHDSVYEKNKQRYEKQMIEMMKKSMDELDHNRQASFRLQRKHRQRASSMETLPTSRTRTQKTAHTDFNQHHGTDSPIMVRKSRKDNYDSHLPAPRPRHLLGTGTQRFQNGANSPSRSPLRNSPARSVKSNAPHNSRNPHGAHAGYTNSPLSQRRLMLMSL